jgi:hypothetical protein
MSLQVAEWAAPKRPPEFGTRPGKLLVTRVWRQAGFKTGGAGFAELGSYSILVGNRFRISTKNPDSYLKP